MQKPTNPYEECESLSHALLATAGFLKDKDDYVAFISIGVVAGAFGLAASQVLALVDDKSFEDWITCIRNERKKVNAISIPTH